MSISSIPSNFLAGSDGTGVRSLLTQSTLDLIWRSRPSAQQQQIQREAAIPRPPANFLPDANITSIARESAWFNLSDAARRAFLESAPSTPSNGLVSSGGAASGFRQGGFSSTTGATGTTTAPLAFETRVDTVRSQTPTQETATAYRSIWKTDADFTAVLRQASDPMNTNGGAIFVSIRAGATGTDPATAERFIQNPYIDDPTRSDDPFDLFERQVTNQQRALLDRFGTEQALLGFDVNGNGFIDNETELFGFDSATGAGPSFAAIFGAFSPSTGPVRLDQLGDLGNRLMVLRSDGTSVRLNQSSLATSPVGGEFAPYTSVQTVLQADANGRLEVVAYARQGTTFGLNLPVAPGALTFAGRTDAASQTPTAGTTAAYTSLFADAVALASQLSPSTNDAGNGSAIFVNVRVGTGAERVANPYTDTPDTNDQFDRFRNQVDAQKNGLLAQILGTSGVTQGLLGLDDGDGVFDGFQELFGFDSAAGPGPDFAALFGVFDSANERLNLGATDVFPNLNNLFVLLPDNSWVRLNRSSDVAPTPANLPAEPGLAGSSAQTFLQRDGANRLEVVVRSTTFGGTINSVV